MSDEITALLSDQYYEPDSAEAMAMAEQLRGNLGDANFLSLSTIDPVRQFGQESRRNTLNAAESRGRLNKTIAAERRELERKKNSETRAEDRTIASEKRALERALAKESRGSVQSAAEKAQELEDKKEFERFKKELKGETEARGLKPTGKAVQDYTKAEGLLSQINGVGADFLEMDEKQLEMLDQPLTDALTDMFTPAPVERYIQDQYLYDDPKVKNYRAKLADVESEFSRLMSGLAVTGFEMKDRQKWSPYASGIGRETRVARLQNLKEKLQNQRSIAEKTYDFKGFTPEAAEQSTQEVTAQPKQYLKVTELDGVKYGQDADGNWNRIN